jgi:hypothetical protein
MKCIGKKRASVYLLALSECTNKSLLLFHKSLIFLKKKREKINAVARDHYNWNNKIAIFNCARLLVIFIVRNISNLTIDEFVGKGLEPSCNKKSVKTVKEKEEGNVTLLINSLSIIAKSSLKIGRS